MKVLFVITLLIAIIALTIGITTYVVFDCWSKLFEENLKETNRHIDILQNENKYVKKLLMTMIIPFM